MVTTDAHRARLSRLGALRSRVSGDPRGVLAEVRVLKEEFLRDTPGELDVFENLFLNSCYELALKATKACGPVSDEALATLFDDYFGP